MCGLFLQLLPRLNEFLRRNGVQTLRVRYRVTHAGRLNSVDIIGAPAVVFVIVYVAWRFHRSSRT